MTKQQPSEDINRPDIRKPRGFPQITRLFSAPAVRRTLLVTGKTLIWILVTLFIAANVAMSNRGVAEYIFRASSRPAWLSRALFRGSDILGTSVAEEEPARSPSQTIGRDYSYWQKIIKEYPDYRDGHYMLALLAFQQGDMDASQKHLQKVRRLDPNFPGIAQLEGLLAAE